MTKEVNFTVPWLDKLKPPVQREDYRDKSTRGLQLRVSPTGVKSFSYAFRFGSKMRLLTDHHPNSQYQTLITKAFMMIEVIATGVVSPVTLDKICPIML